MFIINIMIIIIMAYLIQDHLPERLRVLHGLLAREVGPHELQAVHGVGRDPGGDGQNRGVPAPPHEQVHGGGHMA